MRSHVFNRKALDFFGGYDHDLSLFGYGSGAVFMRREIQNAKPEGIPQMSKQLVLEKIFGLPKRASSRAAWPVALPDCRALLTMKPRIRTALLANWRLYQRSPLIPSRQTLLEQQVHWRQRRNLATRGGGGDLGLLTPSASFSSRL